MPSASTSTRGSCLRTGSASTKSSPPIQASNVNLPTGTISGRERTFTVLADGQLLNASAYAPMVVAYRNGNPVRLGDVARVYDGVEQDKTASWYQGMRSITLVDPEAARLQRRRGRR